MRLVLAPLLLVAACGLPPEAPPPVDEALCTAQTLQPGWECCDDGQLGCTAEGPLVCHAHQLQPLGVEECERVAADPRRPELHTGTFCQTNASGFLWCPGPLPQRVP